MLSLTAILIIAALIVINGIFVAAEFAIIGTPLASVERKANQGHRVARRVVAILRDPRKQDQYIATAQLGITFASLGLGMYGEHVLALWFADLFAVFGRFEWFPRHAAATVSSIAILTYFHIVLGEMIPKALALQQAEKTTLWITPFLLWVKAALYPLVTGLNALGNLILRLFGVNRQFAQHLGHTPEELEYLIEESQQGGALRAEAGVLLRDLIWFSDLTAAEVMIPRVKVVGIPLGASASHLKTLLRDSNYTRFPVHRGDLDKIAGVVHVKDLLPKLLAGQPIDESDLRPVPFVPHTATVDTVLAAMHRDNSHLAVVMDEYGGTAGIITTKDLLDEVAGEFHEDSHSTAEVSLDPRGRLQAAGTVRIEEVAARLAVDLHSDEVDTIGGLVLSLLDRPPKVGDSVTSGPIRIEVTAVEGNGVNSCLITRLDQPNPLS